LDYSVYRALFVYCIKGTYCIYNDEISTPQLSYREGTLDNLDIAYPGSKVLTDVEKTKAVASGAIFGTRSVPDLSNSNGETGTQIFRTGEAVVQIACQRHGVAGQYKPGVRGRDDTMHSSSFWLTNIDGYAYRPRHHAGYHSLDGYLVFSRRRKTISPDSTPSRKENRRSCSVPCGCNQQKQETESLLMTPVGLG
jgi:hypothetical protein